MNRNLKMVVCHSEEIDSADLVQDLIQQAEHQLEGRSADACLLFAAIDFDHQLILDGIQSKWADIKLVGGTTDGECSTGLGFLEDSAVLIIFSSSVVKFGFGVGQIRNGDLVSACKDAVSQAENDLGGTAGLCLTISGNQELDNARLMDSLEDLLPDGVPVFGGVPGDQWRFEKLYQFGKGTVYDDAIPILLISDDIDYAYGIDSGWEALGAAGRVTKSEDNIVYTINEQTAKEYYETTLGMSLEDTFSPGEFPIVILDEQDAFQFQRAPVGFLPDGSGGIKFFGTMPQGAKVTIAGANRDVIIKGTESSIDRAINNVENRDQIVGALIVSCSGRRVMLGTMTGKEPEIIKKALGPDIPFGGFYGYGEFAPPQSSFRRSGLHNQTMVSLIFLSD